MRGLYEELPIAAKSGRIKYGLYFRNRHWLDILILRFLSLAVQLLEFEVKRLK